MTKRPALRVLPFLGLSALTSGCGVLLGLDQFTEGPAQTTSTGTGTGGTGGGGPLCSIGETLPCDTPLKGPCATGTKTCLADQTGFGACKLDVQPTATDDCVNNIDTTCDGKITCACPPGSKLACTTGLQAACASGTATCKADGTGYDACVPDVTPTATDDCVTQKDTNCDGSIDCACQSGTMTACVTGLQAACAAGKATCKADGTGYDTCVPDVAPTATDDCVGLQDTNCNGIIDCSCQSGATQPCASGLPGACAAGTQTCKPDGTGYGTCLSDAVATVNDDCVSLADTNCNGVVDCVCKSGATQPCASGLPGACAAGTQTCTMDGKGYGACAANVQPGTMPEVCQTIGDEDCDGIACSDNDWSFLAGDASSQVPTSVAIDSSGNIFVAGDFSGTLKLLDKANATSITLTAGGVSTDYFLAKFTPAGDVIWAKNFGVGYPNGTQNRVAVAVDANGNVGIAGELKGAGNFGGGNISAGGVPDIFAAKFDPQGVYKWARAFGSSGYSSSAYTLAFDSSGNVLIGGSERALSLNMDGISLDCNTNPLTYEAFIAKLTSATGAVTWAKQYKEGTTNGNKAITRLVLDGSDNIYATGVFAGSIFLTASASAVGGNDAFVAKLNSSGVVQWGKAIGTAQMEDAQDIALDASGNVLITGSIGGSFNFGGGTVTASGGSGWAFLAKYTNLGVYSNAKIFANSAGGSALGVAVTTDAASNVYLSGSMLGGTNLGGGVLANGGAHDIFLGKFDVSLNPLWSKSFGDGQEQKSAALRFDKATNRLVLAGTDAGSVNFGTGVLAGMDTTTTDLALAKFQP